MTFTKQLTAITTTLLLSFSGMAQESRSQRFERIEAEKIAFITRELNLTPGEAQDFFPIYNQYHKEISRLRHEKRNIRQGEQHNLRSRQVPKTSFTPGNRDVLAFDAKELEVKKVYRKRFAEVVGPARASRFFEAEEEFRNYLLRELQERRRDQKDNE